MFPPVFLLLCALVLALCGCDRASSKSPKNQQVVADMSGGASTTTPSEPALERGLQDRMAHVPLDADVVLTIREASLLELSQNDWLAGLDEALSHASPFAPLAMCETSRETLGTSLCHNQSLERFLLDATAPLHVARSKDHWIFLFENASSPQPSSFQAWKARLAKHDLTLRATDETNPAAFLTLDASHASFKVASLHQASQPYPASPGTIWMRSTSLSIFLIPTTPTDHEPASSQELARKLVSLKPSESWRALQTNRSLQDAMARAGGELSLMVRGDLLTRALTPNNEAARSQRDALSRQLDLIGLSLSRSSRESSKIQGQLFVSSTEQEPIFLDALDPAPSVLDTDLGVLLGPHASGIFHLAASPHSLLEVLKGALDFSQRQQLDSYFAYLKEELLLDVEQAIFDNLTGHFLLIIYEIDPDARRAANQNPEEAAQKHDLFGLSSTREALYMPLRDSFAMEQFLNALTQITRGRMRRQRVDEVIQYVLLEDGELQGAFLLGEDALLWVDSSVAVEQGMRHLNSPRALSAAQTERFGDLLKGRQGFGMWFEPERYFAEDTQSPTPPPLIRSLSEVKDFRLTSYAFKRAPQGEERSSAEAITPGHESATFSFLIEPEEPRSPEQ